MLTGGIITIAVALLLGVLAVYQILRARAQLRLLTVTPTTPIASTPHGGVVEIQGTVVPSEQGLTVSPASGAQAVVYHVDVLNTAGSVTCEYTAKDRREFWLQDQSGAYARILPESAELTVQTLRYSPGQTSHFVRDHVRYLPMPPELLAWAFAVTDKRDDRLVVTEVLILPGERVLAQGIAERNTDGTLFLRNHPDQELVLSTLDEPELRELRRADGRVGWLLVMICLILCAIGLVLAVLGWYADL